VLDGDEWNRLSDHNPVVACFSQRRVVWRPQYSSC
jgi:hypothetical protein